MLARSRESRPYVSSCSSRHCNNSALSMRLAVAFSLIVIVELASSCTDAVAPPLKVPSRIAAMQECPPEEPDCNVGPGGGIDPHNSWVSGDVTITTSATVSLSEPVYDEVTGQEQTTFATGINEHLHVDAGYSYGGATIVNTSFTDPVDQTTSSVIQVTEADLNSDALTEINSASQQIQDVSPSNATAETPMNLVGSTQNADVTAGAIVDLLDTTTVQSSSADGSDFRALMANAASRAEKGSPQTVELGGATLQVSVTKANILEVSDMTSDLTASASSGTVKHVKRYKKNGHEWLLSEMQTDVDAQDAKRKVHQTHLIQFKHLRVFRNPEQDAIRLTARPSTEWIPLQGMPGTISANLYPCGDECNGGYVSSPGPPPPSGVAPPCQADVVANVNSTGPINILYQHGLFSNATTWCDMDPYLRGRFRVRNEIRHSLPSTDYYENQASQLEGNIRADAASYPGPYSFVGHSNGGIVSRLASQHLVYEGNYVAGVVTVSSPQAGAPLARVGKAALTAALAVPLLASKVACNLVAHIVCTTARDLQGPGYYGLISILGPIIDRTGRVLGEMTPNNSFYGNLNAGYEPFPRAAVIDQAWDKWTEWRLYGDFRCRLYTECDGRHVVALIDKTYHRYLKCAVIGGIFSFFIPGAGTVAAACALSAANLKGYDLLYKRLSVGSDHGDAVVPVHSQRYPNLDTGGQFYVFDSDSHVGVTQSTRQTGPSIATALNQRLFIPFGQ
jgi:pimeloyl-ACP methyl ester carboxylesterase